MIISNRKILPLITLTLIFACSTRQELFVDYSNIKIAVANLNDKAIYTHFMPYIEASAHPSITDHERNGK